MSNAIKLSTIHIVWQGPLTMNEAATADTGSDYGLYQIYGTHDVSGPDTLLYIGQADSGTFHGRIRAHEAEWGRWQSDANTVYLGRLADVAPITNESWGSLIDRAEAVMIYKIGVPYNSSRIKTLKYRQPILVVNHGRRHRLPECVSTIAEFINTDTAEFKIFGPLGHPVPPPIPPDFPVEGE